MHHASPSRFSRCDGCARTFGDVDALRGVDLEVHAGEVVGLLGPNGAGKTTLVRIVATLIEPDSGQVSVCGADASTAAGEVRAHLGLAGQFASVDELLTGRENLELIGRLYGIDTTDCRVRVEALLVSLGLTRRGRSPGEHVLRRDAPPPRPRRDT